MTLGTGWITAVVGIAGCLLGVAGSGCSMSRKAFDYSREPDPRAQEYVVGPSDQLRISVWRDPDLSLELKVRPDGTITMPLVGDIRASGRTPSSIRDEIEKRVAQYVKAEASKVTVAVVAVNSYRFSVAGNVERPGLYSYAYYVTVMEAPAIAGGPNRFADPGNAVILRTYSPGNTRQIPIDFDRLARGQRPEQNIVVLPGDTIFVP